MIDIPQHLTNHLSQFSVHTDPCQQHYNPPVDAAGLRAGLLSGRHQSALLAEQTARQAEHEAAGTAGPGQSEHARPDAAHQGRTPHLPGGVCAARDVHSAAGTGEGGSGRMEDGVW